MQLPGRSQVCLDPFQLGLGRQQGILLDGQLVVQRFLLVLQFQPAICQLPFPILQFLPAIVQFLLSV